MAALVLRLTGVDLTRCSVYHMGRLHLIALLRPGALPVSVRDTS